MTTAIANPHPSDACAAGAELRPELASDEFLRRIPHDYARSHLVVSQGSDGEIETIACSSDSPTAAVHNVGVRLRRRIQQRHADPELIARVIDQAYSQWAERGHISQPESQTADDLFDKANSEIDHLLAEADRDLLSTEGKGPVIKLVDAMIFEALGRGASDIHVQPLTDRTLVRYRLDGVLHTVREITPRLTTAVVSRIKVMGRMDIAERRIPQDGRATVTIGPPAPPAPALAPTHKPPGSALKKAAAGPEGKSDTAAQNGGRSIDLRISTLPTSYGERAVLRLLDHSRQLCEFDRLGMPPDMAERFCACASAIHGIILVTGPTGSGKTTTLYSVLRRIATSAGAGAAGTARGGPGMNIMTIEDPIEYELATVGLTVSQAQVNPRKGVTFATGLRHILRQDPDVIMIGEIRDAETARIAIQSSLTGHLVFSTLHTNDATSAVTRLMDLGVEPYLVSASLRAVLAQRLVRVLHGACQGTGCDECLGTGFRGRTGLFELMVIDEPLREMISRRASLAEIRHHARRGAGDGGRGAGGLRTLREHGQALVAQGLTSQLEVDRVAMEAIGDES